MSIPEQSVQDLYLPVTPIEYPNDHGHATGFFFRHEGSDYLISTKHSFADENGDPIAESVRITLRDDPSDLRLRIHKDIPLVEDGEETWLSLDHSPPVDVAAIELEFDLDNFVNIPLSTDTLLSDDRILGPARDLIIVGYPIIQTDGRLPVIRSGRLASPYGNTFLGNLAFGTDANLHSGTSGSPVFTAPSPYIETEEGVRWVKDTGVSLIGIHSSMIMSPNHDIDEGALNLNISWYAELIPQLLE